MTNVLTIMAKELRELLRDTHVLTLSVGFPFLFYPLMVWGMIQAQVFIEGLAESQSPRVVVSAPADVRAALDKEPMIIVEGDDAALIAGDVDAVVTAAEDGDGMAVTLKWRSTESRSKRAKALITERLEAVEDARLDALATGRGLSPDRLRPWEIKTENTAPAKQMTIYIMSRALPTLLVAVMLMAALYPAVEVVVGERERSTLETTLVSATSRGEVVLGKVMAVVTLTVAAVLGNLVAMGLTLLHLVSLSDKIDTTELALSPGGLLEALPMAAISCVFVAVMMVVSVLPCRTFKAGQNLASITMLVGLGLSSMAFLPGTELTTTTALIPLTNTALIMREATTGVLPLGLAALAGVEMIALTAAMAWVGFKVIASEGFAIHGTLPTWLKWTERLR